MNHSLITGIDHLTVVAVDVAAGVLVLMGAVVLLIMLLRDVVEPHRWALRPETKRPSVPSAVQAHEPAWWPEFERQFAAHVESRA